MGLSWKEGEEISQGRREVVILSSADWDNPFWTNKQHMAVQFARHGWRVLYVDSLGLRRPALCRRDAARIARRLGKGLPFPRKVFPGVWRASPLVLPFHGRPWQRRCNERLLRMTLRWHMRLLDMRAPLIWTYNPLLAAVCASLPRSGIVYHCVDDLAAAPRIDGNAIRRGEAELGRVADMCFVTSRALEKRMRDVFSKVVYEPNVCDLAMFGEARKKALPEPRELAAIPRPRLLFVGALSEYKVDFSLMEAVARAMPDVHLALVGAFGEGQPDSRGIARLPNIHILGPRAYETLPAFMAHADAALLPAPHNAYTEAMFPMKFFEYLAAGLPVAGTRLPALEEFASCYFPGEGPEGFCAAVRRALGGEALDAAAVDRACRHHTWEARFERMMAILGDAAASENPSHLHAETGGRTHG